MRFLATGLLCLSLLLAGCSLGSSSDSDSIESLPPSSESMDGADVSDDNSSGIVDDEVIDDSASSDITDDSTSSGEIEDDGNDDSSNDNPFAGGLENGGEFEGH